jgi:hypothetical protein
MVTLLFLLQTLTANVAPATSFTVAFEHAQQSGDMYRMWCDSTIIKNWNNTEIAAGKSTTANANGEYTFTLTSPGLAAGTHSCFISAYNTYGEAKGTPENIIVGAAPSIPVGFRIIVK